MASINVELLGILIKWYVNIRIRDAMILVLVPVLSFWASTGKCPNAPFDMRTDGPRPAAVPWGSEGPAYLGACHDPLAF